VENLDPPIVYGTDLVQMPMKLNHLNPL